ASLQGRAGAPAIRVQRTRVLPRAAGSLGTDVLLRALCSLPLVLRRVVRSLPLVLRRLVLAEGVLENPNELAQLILSILLRVEPHCETRKLRCHRASPLPLARTGYGCTAFAFMSCGLLPLHRIDATGSCTCCI